MKRWWVWLVASGLSGCVTYHLDAKGYPVNASTAPQLGASSHRLVLARQYMRHQRWAWALFHLRLIQQRAPENEHVAAAIAQCLEAQKMNAVRAVGIKSPK
jgi:hypothetical protein